MDNSEHRRTEHKLGRRMEHRMEQKDNIVEADIDIAEDFPEVDIYSVNGEQTDLIKGYLTDEAVLLTKSGEAVCLAVAEEEQVAGAICARLDPANERCLDIISLYVLPEYRGRHLGGTLIAEITDAFLDGTDGMIERVEMLFSDSPELEAFLKEIGFQMTEVNDTEDEIEPFSRLLPVSALADSALFQYAQAASLKGNLLKFQELSDARVLQLSSILDEAEVNYLGMDGLKRVLPEISFVMTDKEMNPIACALFTANGDRLCLSQLYITSDSPHAGMAVLQAAGKALLESYPDAELEISLLERSSQNLLERLLGDAGRNMPLTRAVWEI